MTESDIKTAFDHHKDAIYRFAWRMTGSDKALDITQDVFLTLLRTPARFDPLRGALRSFLLGIARNLALTRIHQETRWTALEEDESAVEPIEPGEARHMVARQ